MAKVWQKCKEDWTPPCTKAKCGHPWTVRYREPGGRSGRQREKSFPRKTPADAFATKMENDKNEGTYIDPSRGQITVRAWVNQWFENRVLAQKTRVSYGAFFDHYVIPILGRKTLAGTNTGDIQNLVAEMHRGYDGRAPLAPSTIAARINCLSAVFNDAVRDKRIPDNPCHGVNLPRVKDQKVDKDQIPTRVQVAQIRSVLPVQFRLSVDLMAGAGLRISESLAVSKSCKREETLRVRWQTGDVTDKAGNRKVGLVPLKARSEGDYRDIPLAPFLDESMDAHEDEFGVHTIDEYQGLYFKSDFGLVVSANNFRNRWAEAVQEDLGLNFTPHDLRHFFVSTALAGGVALNEVSHWLGHKSITVTADIYGHLVEDAPDRARRVIEAAFRPETPLTLVA